MSNRSTYALAVPVTINGHTRTLRLNNRALVNAGTTLKRSGFGGSVRGAVFGSDLDAAVVFVVAAAALEHEDPKISALKLADEVDNDPGSYVDLVVAVIDATRLAYEAMGVLQRKKDGGAGESKTTATTPSTSGEASSDAPPASASPG